MTLKLTDEMRQAIQQHPGQPLKIEDEQTHQVYLLIAKPTEPNWQFDSVHELLAAAQQELKAGEGIPFEEVDRELSAKLGIPPLA